MAHDREHFDAMSCPNDVTWTDEIEKMFTPLDVDHMKSRGVDLSSYQSVKINAVGIYTRVASGSMPPTRLRRGSVVERHGQYFRVLDPARHPAIAVGDE